MATTLAQTQARSLNSISFSRHCKDLSQCSSNAVFGGANFRRTLSATRKLAVPRHGNRFAVSATAERPVWLPGTPPAKHLESIPNAAGNFGFDPLNLGEDPEALRWYVQAELVHARFAMLGVAGILVQEIVRKAGADIPTWYEAGAASYFAPTATLFAVQMLLFGWVETKRYFDFVNPGSQKDAWFFFLEPSFEGLEPGYPGGPFFNFSGFGTGVTKNDNVAQMRTKEIKNGRLAMVAFLGFAIQALVTKTGPIENLLAHLADPFHVTVMETLSKTV